MGSTSSGSPKAAPAMGDDKPFDDEPFDAGVEADEATSPKEFIQQLSGKLGQSLRKYEKDMGTPDLELEKFAVNSVLSATNTAEMDAEDQKDIIDKVKTSGLENDLEAGDDAAPAPDGGEEVDVSVDAESPELGEATLDEFGGGPPEDREYDAMQAYRERQGNTYPSSTDYGNDATDILKKHLGLDKPEKNGTIAENLRSILMETSPTEPKDVTQGGLPNKKFVRTKDGVMGATIWVDSGKISLTLHDVSDNQYGYKNDRMVFSSWGVAPEQFTKRFIAHELTKTDNGMGQAYIEDITPYLADIDELLTLVEPMVEPAVEPKREVVQPKRIRERDLPFRKPVRETKTKPKANL